MAFCTSCGASMEGQFCAQCGARAGAQGSTPPAASSEPGDPPRKRSNLLVWALAGCGGLILLMLIGVFAVGLFIRSKAGELGDNPGLAAAKILASMNPGVEVVSADERAGKITLREKRTGKTVTLDFQDIKNGRISFEDRAVRWGTGSLVDVPGWVPKCPGARMESSLSAQGKEGEGGTFQLKCDGSVEKVADYYEQALKGAGMQVERHATRSGGTSMVMLTGSETAGRSVTANVTSGDQGTVATIIYATKD